MGKPNIFKEVKIHRETIEKRIGGNVFGIEFELEYKRLEAVDEVIRFLSTLSWIKHVRTKERMNYYLKSAGLSARKTATAFETTVNAIDVSLNHVTKKIRGLIGVPLSRIMQAQDISTIESALDEFRKMSQTGVPVYGYFLSGIEPFLPKPQYNPKFNLVDCHDELSIIGLYTGYMEYLFSHKCDREKLAHVLSLLSSLNGSKDDREAVKLLFSGEFSQSETEEHLTIRKQIGKMQEWLKQQNPYSD